MKDVSFLRALLEDTCRSPPTGKLLDAFLPGIRMLGPHRPNEAPEKLKCELDVALGFDSMSMDLLGFTVAGMGTANEFCNNYLPVVWKLCVRGVPAFTTEERRSFLLTARAIRVATARLETEDRKVNVVRMGKGGETHYDVVHQALIICLTDVKKKSNNSTSVAAIASESMNVMPTPVAAATSGITTGTPIPPVVATPVATTITTPIQSHPPAHPPVPAPAVLTPTIAATSTPTATPPHQVGPFVPYLSTQQIAAPVTIVVPSPPTMSLVAPGHSMQPTLAHPVATSCAPYYNVIQNQYHVVPTIQQTHGGVQPQSYSMTAAPAVAPSSSSSSSHSSAGSNCTSSSTTATTTTAPVTGTKIPHQLTQVHGVHTHHPMQYQQKHFHHHIHQQQYYPTVVTAAAPTLFTVL